jgi:hypothetical protein
MVDKINQQDNGMSRRKFINIAASLDAVAAFGVVHPVWQKNVNKGSLLSRWHPIGSLLYQTHGY